LGVSDTEDRDKDNKTSLKEERVIDTEDRDKNNETGLQEERVIKILTTVLPYTRCSLLRFEYLPVVTTARITKF